MTTRTRVEMAAQLLTGNGLHQVTDPVLPTRLM